MTTTTETKATHTPGPWRILKDGRMLKHKRVPAYDVQQDCYDGLGDFVCGLATEADARLIAAAPELLAAGGAMLDAIDRRFAGETDRRRANCVSPAMEAAIATLRAAIAKAEGRN